LSSLSVAIAAASCVGLLGCAGAPTSDNHAGDYHRGPPLTAAVLDAKAQAALTPDEVKRRLAAGNERFMRGELTPRDYMAQVHATAKGQYPMATVLSCLDSRIPPETIFDQGIGDIFVGRVAGNFENEDMLGSFEFSTKLAGTKLIVVMGHTACGAVKGACDGAQMGNLTATLANIKPAIEASQSVPGEKTSKNTEYVNAVAEANVRQTVTDIVDRSEIIRALVQAGQLKVVGAMYDLGTGKVRWL